MTNTETQTAANLEVLRQQYPGKLCLDRRQTANALSVKNPITVDRLAARGLLRPNRATRKPLYPLAEIARFLAETSASV